MGDSPSGYHMHRISISSSNVLDVYVTMKTHNVRQQGVAEAYSSSDRFAILYLAMAGCGSSHP